MHCPLCKHNLLDEYPGEPKPPDTAGGSFSPYASVQGRASSGAVAFRVGWGPSATPTRVAPEPRNHVHQQQHPHEPLPRTVSMLSRASQNGAVRTHSWQQLHLGTAPGEAEWDAAAQRQQQLLPAGTYHLLAVHQLGGPVPGGGGGQGGGHGGVGIHSMSAPGVTPAARLHDPMTLMPRSAAAVLPLAPVDEAGQASLSSSSSPGGEARRGGCSSRVPNVSPPPPGFGDVDAHVYNNPIAAITGGEGSTTPAAACGHRAAGGGGGGEGGGGGGPYTLVSVGPPASIAPLAACSTHNSSSVASLADMSFTSSCPQSLSQTRGRGAGGTRPLQLRGSGTGEVEGGGAVAGRSQAAAVASTRPRPRPRGSRCTRLHLPLAHPGGVGRGGGRGARLLTRRPVLGPHCPDLLARPGLA